MDLEKAERLTKAAAQNRQIRIELTREQIQQLSEQYRKLNPAEAAELIFTSGNEFIAVIYVEGFFLKVFMFLF
jgi:hypothetical protein